MYIAKCLQRYFIFGNPNMVTFLVPISPTDYYVMALINTDLC